MDKNKKLFNEDKMYTFAKGFTMGAGLKQTVQALSYTREKHRGQNRKDGSPYVIHPLTMVCNAIAMGITDDNTLAVILLHDVVEDCGVTLTDLPVGDIARRGVEAITFKVYENETKEEAKKRYYNNMLDSKEATVAKLLDRCHNVSSMAGVFNEEKIQDYISETREYVLPLIRKAKDKYPDMSNIIFCLKYQIVSVIEAIELTLEVKERQEK